MWQSLSFGANYKAAYCMAVCPAGEDVIGPYLEKRTDFLNEVVRPLQGKSEDVYVIEGSDAEQHVAKRFVNKNPKIVKNGIRPGNIKQFLGGLPLIFQREKSKGMEAVYHFSFTGEDTTDATVKISNQILEINEGHSGNPDLVVNADSNTWVKFLRGEVSIIKALLFRKIKVKGSIGLLKQFAAFFPS